MAYVDCSFVLVFFVSFFCCRCCSKKDRNQNHLLPLLAAQWYSFEGKLAMVLLPRQSSTLQREKKVESSRGAPTSLRYSFYIAVIFASQNNEQSMESFTDVHRLMAENHFLTLHQKNRIHTRICLLFLNGF